MLWKTPPPVAAKLPFDDNPTMHFRHLSFLVLLVAAACSAVASERWWFLPNYQHDIRRVEKPSGNEEPFFESLPKEAERLAHEDSGLTEAQRQELYWHAARFPHREFTELMPQLNVYGWYACDFDIPAHLHGLDLIVDLGIIDDTDETFVNGTRVGGIGQLGQAHATSWQTDRLYRVPSHLLVPLDNSLAVHVWSLWGLGGMVGPPVIKATPVKPDAQWEIAFVQDSSAPTGGLNKAQSLKEALSCFLEGGSLVWQKHPQPWHGSVTVTAAPDPSGSWPYEQPAWSGDCYGSTGATAFVNTNTAGMKIITATCGSIIKRIKIAVADIHIYSETSNGTVNDGTLPNLTECMEGRYITYTASLSSFVPSNLTKSFVFHFVTASGETWTTTVNSTANSVNCTAIADQVVNSPTASTHHFSTPIYCTASVGGITLTSETINIEVYELWIDYFKDATTQKSWKICIGEFISHNAIASSDCTNWNWDMEEGIPDAWNPIGGNSKSGSSMKIPYTDLARASNSWFGEAYGEVNVSCRDGENNFYQRYSTNMREASTKAKVFFPPDLNVDGGEPTQAKPPCWFVFWKQGSVVATMNTAEWLYSDLYGSSSNGTIYLSNLAWTQNSGPETRRNLRTNVYVTFTGSGEYLDCVAETLMHEGYHLFCENQWGDLGIRPGHSDSDGLPDTEEDQPTNYQGAEFPVSFTNNADTYAYLYGLSNGYDYSDQEVRCRIVEKNGTLSIDRSKDWSADSRNPKCGE